jgi:hypothetical protein
MEMAINQNKLRAVMASLAKYRDPFLKAEVCIGEVGDTVYTLSAYSKEGAAEAEVERIIPENNCLYYTDNCNDPFPPLLGEAITEISRKIEAAKD